MATVFRLIALLLGFFLALPQLGAAAPRRDGHGDPLPPDALARIGTARFRHFATIYALAYSPDGKRIAGGDTFEAAGQSSIVVWDADTGRQLHRLPGHGHVIRGLAFSPNSRHLAAVCGDGSLRIWDVTAEKVLSTVKPDGAFFSVAFTADGKVVSADGKSVGLWEVDTGWRLARLAGLSGTLRSVAVSPDDKQIAACDQNGRILVWDRAAGKEAHRFQIASRFGGYVAFSPDGKTLACGGEDVLYLWDLQTSKEIQRIRTPDWFLTSQPFLADRRVLVSYKEDTVRFWDVAKGEEVRRLVTPRGRVAALALSPDGNIVVTASDCETSIRRWDARTGEELERPEGHDLPVVSVGFAPDGKSVATASNEPTFRLWDASSGRVRRRFRCGADRVSSLAFSTHDTLAAGMRDLASIEEAVTLWDVKTGRRLGGFGEKGGGTRRIAISADGTTVAASVRDNKVLLWDVARRTARPHPFLGGQDVTSSQLQQFVPFALAPDGKTLAVTHGHLLLWDAAHGREQVALGRKEMRSVPLEQPGDFSPDGRRLATFEGKTVRVREPQSGQVLHTFELARGETLCVTFSPDGRRVASADTEGIVHLWDLATGKEQRTFHGHAGWVFCLAFAPDGERLASGSSDATVLIWSIKEDRPAEASQPRLSAKRREALWSRLGDRNVVAGERAVWELVLAGDAAVAFLQERIAPVQPPSAKRVAALIADLDSERFEVREKAQGELLELGEATLPMLRKTLEQQPSLEVRRRAENILARLEKWERTREARIVDVLEHSASASARPLLERLAGGIAEARLTREARAALKRLDRRGAAGGFSGPIPTTSTR